MKRWERKRLFTGVTSRAFLLAGWMLTMITGSHAQNQLPSISNVSLRNNITSGQLTVSYEVSDGEKDPVAVSLRVYDANGTLIGSDAPGDTVSRVSGNGQTKVWNYSGCNAKDIRIRLMASDGQPANINKLVALVDSNRTRSNLEKIVGNRNSATGPAHLDAVKNIISRALEENTLQIRNQHFRYNDHNGQNIAGYLPGSAGDDTVYLLIAHFDTVNGSPGADDNGSGIAGLIEAMHVLSKFKFRHTIGFVAVDKEENGLIGSREYISSLDKKKSHIMGVLNLDMIGYYSERPNSQLVPAEVASFFPGECSKIAADSNKGNFVLMIANEASRSLSTVFGQSVQRYTPSLKLVTLSANETVLQALPDLAGSDHASFWKKGYKAIHIGDGGPTRNPNYHSKNDTMATINFSFLNNIIKATIASLATLAQLEHASVYDRQIDLSQMR